MGKINRLRSNDVERILSVLVPPRDVAKYSHIAAMDEIAGNCYNLNIPRYVDTYEPPPPIDIIAVTNELIEIRRECAVCEEKICEMISDMVATDEQTAHNLQEVQKMFTVPQKTANANKWEQISLEDL